MRILFPVNRIKAAVYAAAFFFTREERNEKGNEGCTGISFFANMNEAAALFS